ncbi:MAG: undecaprenyldiphospho-muramoylpentapeptide beta-N-acetylglucosaminyltransferase, partial [Alphaproteobacteria bacterium]|nr:undecaprenyldiphospho-muramoylpentapeptide beta-N-acetylglucosaminyltransferase [Alphaproteobacteria bacterium]
MNNKDFGLILLSAGGTGGHMFPAAALARDLISRGYTVALATDPRGKALAHVFGSDIPVHVLQAGKLGGGIKGKVTGMAKLSLGMIQAWQLIGKLKPSVVVGFGGYPSVPAVYMAQRCGIPTVIHEQNAVLGRANKMLSSRAARIAMSWPQQDGALDKASSTRVVVTGNPVREEISTLYTRPYPALKQDGTLRIFVMGGSLGASIFSTIVPQALANLPPAQRARLEITQQCRAVDLATTREIYEIAGIKARLETFFFDVPELLGQTHLVVSRSGASTVAEVTAAGRPAIFVPYPHHADHQQKVNADSVADAGGAWVMTQDGFTKDALMARIETFLQNPETLFRAAEASRSCGRPDAARKLGNVVTALASG